MSNDGKQTTDRTDTRKEWSTPRVVRMAVGDAENSANPFGSDGQFSAGS